MTMPPSATPIPVPQPAPQGNGVLLGVDTAALAHSLRSLTPLSLVVSTEPIDVARALDTLLSGRRTWLQVATMYGIKPMADYLKGKSLLFSGKAVEPLALIEEMHRSDPKDDQYIFLVPDLWPHLQNLEVLAAIQRFRDQRELQVHVVKCAVIVVPSLSYVPETFHRMFDIHHDNGLTEPQARAEIESLFAMLDVKCAPESLEEMQKLCTGRASSEIARMVSHAIVLQKPWDPEKRLDPAGLRDWIVKHHPPRPSPGSGTP
jgi:hypothetical protein